MAVVFDDHRTDYILWVFVTTALMLFKYTMGHPHCNLYSPMAIITSKLPRTGGEGVLINQPYCPIVISSTFLLVYWAARAMLSMLQPKPCTMIVSVAVSGASWKETPRKSLICRRKAILMMTNNERREMANHKCVQVIRTCTQRVFRCEGALGLRVRAP